jgi:hypothetical protein
MQCEAGDDWPAWGAEPKLGTLLRWNSLRPSPAGLGVRWRGPRDPPRQSSRWVLLGDQLGGLIAVIDGDPVHQAPLMSWS